MLYTSDTLDELEQMIVSEYSPILNLNIPPPVFDVPVLTAKELQASGVYLCLEEVC